MVESYGTPQPRTCGGRWWLGMDLVVSLLCELLCDNVRHHEECKHTFDGAAVTAKGDGKDLASAATAKGYAEDLAPAETAKADQRLQIAVMIRSYVFRDFRARQINSTLGLWSYPAS